MKTYNKVTSLRISNSYHAHPILGWASHPRSGCFLASDVVRFLEPLRRLISVLLLLVWNDSVFYYGLLADTVEEFVEVLFGIGVINFTFLRVD